MFLNGPQPQTHNHFLICIDWLQWHYLNDVIKANSLELEDAALNLDDKLFVEEGSDKTIIELLRREFMSFLQEFQKA